jgi:hypothetical protein
MFSMGLGHISAAVKGKGRSCVFLGVAGSFGVICGNFLVLISTADIRETLLLQKGWWTVCASYRCDEKISL